MTALALLWPASTLAQADCAPIRFRHGHSSADVTGVVPPNGRDDSTPAMLCYSLAVADGQRAMIRVVSGDNVAVTIPGVGDARDAYEFATRRGTYRLEVFQLMPGGAGTPFRMRVQVK